MIHRTRESIAADIAAFLSSGKQIQKIPRGVMTDVEETRKERQDASDWFNKATPRKSSAPVKRDKRSTDFMGATLSKL